MQMTLSSISFNLVLDSTYFCKAWSRAKVLLCLFYKYLCFSRVSWETMDHGVRLGPVALQVTMVCKVLLAPLVFQVIQWVYFNILMENCKFNMLEFGFFFLCAVRGCSFLFSVFHQITPDLRVMIQNVIAPVLTGSYCDPNYHKTYYIFRL